MTFIVLVRHGQSEWNLQNRFTGWVDVGLTNAGVNEAIKSGDLIILESTSPVGTTKKIQEILIDCGVDLTDVHIAYCPERVLPGKIMTELLENDRVVGGLTSISTKKIKDFYGSFVKGNILETNAKTNVGRKIFSVTISTE